MTVTQQDVDAFLAHHGVKGMKWGVRSARVKAFGSRKAKIAGAGAASFLISHNVSVFLRKQFGLSKSLQAVVTGTGTVVGTNAARAYLNRHGQAPYSQLAREGES